MGAGNFFKYLQDVLTLAKDLERTSAELKETRKDITQLTLAVQHLHHEIELLKQQAANDAQRRDLEWKIKVMELEKQLPSGVQPAAVAMVKVAKPDGSDNGGEGEIT